MLTVPRDVPDPEVEIAKEEAMTGQYLEKSPAAAASFISSMVRLTKGLKG